MRRIIPRGNERGMALPLAVFALVIIGALVAGIFFTGRVEQRSGTNTAASAQAFEAAEAGVTTVLSRWTAGNYSAVQPGYSTSIARTSLGGKAAFNAEIERISRETFLLTVEGEQFRSATQDDANLIATRTVARLLKLDPVSMSVSSALLARGDVTVRGTADLSGGNTDPPTWSSGAGGVCDVNTDTLPGIITNGDVRVSGSPTIDGDPPYEEYASVDDSAFTRPFNELAPSADITLLTGGNISPFPLAVLGDSTTCNRSSNLNWGEPYGGTGSGLVTACQDYFPVIYSKANLRLSNGRGQGVLLVDGDLDLAGNFVFNGIIIVKGTFESSHGTNVVHGAVMSSNATLDDMTLAGTPTVNYSACAVSRALRGAADVSPLAGRSWVQLY